MYLKSLFLQNFRNYEKAEFKFKEGINVVAGPNAAGKTNLLEAIFLLSAGQSFKAQRDDQAVRFGEKVSRINGVASSSADENTELQIVIQTLLGFLQKKFSINGVTKSKNNFAGILTSVLFLPTDLDIIIGQPSSRRRFLDDVLEQVDSKYSLALTIYTKALRQRNALLERAREQGLRDEKTFDYWDSLLIANGKFIAKKREEFISFTNHRKKELFEFEIIYDKSEISEERLEKYKAAETGAGVTLVGPHRDDVLIQNQESGIPPEARFPLRSEASAKRGRDQGKEGTVIKFFASRGQQRLVVLELKLAQIAYIEEKKGEKPVLLLDDIFSELDEQYIRQVLKLLPDYQVIITTTHREFVEGLAMREGNVIELRSKTS